MSTSMRRHGSQEGPPFDSKSVGGQATPSRWKVRRLSVAAAGLVLGTAFATAALADTPAPASAAVALPPNGPVVTRVDAWTNLDLVNPKSVTAYCRGGTKLIGTGFSRTGGGAGVMIDEAVPTVGQIGADDRVKVTAYQTPAGAPFAWSLRAWAFCASGVSNVQVVYDESDFDTTAPKTAEAECLFGTKVVGTAFEARGASGEVVVTKIDPVPGSGVVNDKVVVKAHPDDNGITGSWSVRAYAFCATAPPGLEIVSNTRASTGTSWTVAADCTGTKVALGAGGYVSDAATGNVLLTSLASFELVTGQQGAVMAATEDANGTNAAWDLTTKVICANR